METAGLLESRWEDAELSEAEGRPRRRLYRVTGLGEAALADARRARAGDAVPTSAAGVVVSAPRLPERWVRMYTVGLPPETRAERRDEIASDVYEQCASNGHGARAQCARRRSSGARCAASPVTCCGGSRKDTR